MRGFKDLFLSYLKQSLKSWEDMDISVWEEVVKHWRDRIEANELGAGEGWDDSSALTGHRVIESYIIYLHTRLCAISITIYTS